MGNTPTEMIQEIIVKLYSVLAAPPIYPVYGQGLAAKNVIDH
jgi:hypothetical protein